MSATAKTSAASPSSFADLPATPYEEALRFVRRHPGCGGSVRLEKLVLSLYNPECAYSVRECLDGLDQGLTSVAVSMVAYYAGHGENAALRAAGEEILRNHHELWDIGVAGDEAKRAKAEEARR